MLVLIAALGIWFLCGFFAQAMCLYDFDEEFSAVLGDQAKDPIVTRLRVVLLLLGVAGLIVAWATNHKMGLKFF